MRTSFDHLTGPARAALIVAHPGHECRLHGWLKQNSAVVFILTEGSGRTGKPRIDKAAAYLTEIGAQRGSVFGRFTDATLYGALLSGDIKLFCDLADELAGDIVGRHFDYVVGDSMEGYNPVHDVCRILIDAAVVAARERGLNVSNYEFPVVNPTPRVNEGGEVVSINLDDETFNQKVNAARRFYPELVAEFEKAVGMNGSGLLREYLQRHGEPLLQSEEGLNVFRTEYLRRIPERKLVDQSKHAFFEEVGESLVAAGHYQQVIRYREHFLPIAAALDEHFAVAD